MSAQLPYNVYTGFWINWAKGAVLGSTLTLGARDAAAFLAFLVIFVRYAGSKSWRILRFLLHRYRVHRRITVPDAEERSPSPQVRHEDENGLYYQQQVVLRNESSDRAAIWDFINLAYHWRSKLGNAPRRSAKIIAITMVHAAGWIVASLFVSRVANTSSPEVMIRPVNCGFAPLSFDTKADKDTALGKLLGDMNDAWSYAQLCYVDNTTSQGCTMPYQQVLAAENPNDTCPFPGLCMYSDSAALTVDTGYINSNLHLGINAPPSEQINYEITTTCAPLNTSSFESNVTAVSGSLFPTGDLIKVFDLGPNSDWGNVTYEYDTHVAIGQTEIGYQVYLAPYWGVNSDNFWFPVSQLNRSDADITLIFLSANDIIYPSPVDDPIFAAHQSFMNSDNEIYYSPDNYVTIVGCTERQQYCLDQAVQGNPVCTGLANWATTTNNLYNMYQDGEMTDAQYDTAYRIAVTANNSLLYWTLGSRVAGCLNASNSVMGIYQTAELPNGQWMIEVGHWLATSFAYLQQSVVQYASGQQNFDPSLIIPPFTAYQEQMCYRQIVKSLTGYTSFSFFGVAFVIVLGTIIILLRSSIHLIAAYTWPKWNHRDDRQRGQYCSRAWNLDNKFQLQKRAFQGDLHGNWQKDDDHQIPLTTDDEKFPYFAIAAEGDARQCRQRFRPKLRIAHQNGEPTSSAPQSEAGNLSAREQAEV